ncbi:hypothetical protein Selli2_30190 [Sellimonas catena]|uniref:Uncharacterized protein n=1 Tax=Sellimonas catena TaxID=2994035 RepID=A0A9W6CHP0_9FIRM|nr:hypothetical protein Selli2_30190 [Sellimonas catena]
MLLYIEGIFWCNIADQTVNARLIKLTQEDKIFQIREGCIILPGGNGLAAGKCISGL